MQYILIVSGAKQKNSNNKMKHPIDVSGAKQKNYDNKMKHPINTGYNWTVVFT